MSARERIAGAAKAGAEMLVDVLASTPQAQPLMTARPEVSQAIQALADAPAEQAELREPRFKPWTLSTYQNAVARIHSEEQVVSARRAVLSMAEGLWRALCPLLLYGERDDTQGNRDGAGYPPMHPETPEFLCSFIGHLSSDLREWVAGVADYPNSEGTDFSASSNLWVLEYQFGTLFLLKDSTSLDPTLRQVLAASEPHMEGFLARFDEALAELDDLLHPEEAERRRQREERAKVGGAR